MSRAARRDLARVAVAGTLLVVAALTNAACVDGDPVEGEIPGTVHTFEDEWGRRCTVWDGGYGGGIDCD